MSRDPNRPLTPEEQRAVDRQGEYIAWQQQVNKEIEDRRARREQAAREANGD